MSSPNGWREWAFVLGVIAFAVVGATALNVYVPQLFGPVVVALFLVGLGGSLWRQRRQRERAQRREP